MKIEEAEKYIRNYINENGKNKTYNNLVIQALKMEGYTKSMINIEHYTIHVDYDCGSIYISDDRDPNLETITDYKILDVIPEIFNLFRGK